MSLFRARCLGSAFVIFLIALCTLPCFSTAQGSIFHNSEYEDFIEEDDPSLTAVDDAYHQHRDEEFDVSQGIGRADASSKPRASASPNSGASSPSFQDSHVEYDPDEFVGFGPSVMSVGSVESVDDALGDSPSSMEQDDDEVVNDPRGRTAERDASRKALPIDADESPRSYAAEMSVVVAMMIYGLNFLYGRRLNERIATVWATEFAPLFRQHFTRVGDGSFLMISSSSEYRLLATGRANCHGLQAVLELKRRQDLYSLLLGMVFPSHDRLVITIPLPEETSRFVFAAIARNEKSFLERYPSVKQLASKVRKHTGLPSKWNVYSETDEATSALLHRNVISTLCKYEKMIESLLITDQYPIEKHKHVLQVIMKIPSEKDMNQMTVPLKMVFFLVDSIAGIALSPSARARIAQNRQSAEKQKSRASHAERQEASQERKLERLRAKREELGNNPSKLAKFEERERKRQMKRKSKSQFKVMV